MEWGKGKVQKQEKENEQKRLEDEANKPFARTKDDPELDAHYRDRDRWGDPMAGLVTVIREEEEMSGCEEKRKRWRGWGEGKRQELMFHIEKSTEQQASL